MTVKDFVGLLITPSGTEIVLEDSDSEIKRFSHWETGKIAKSFGNEKILKVRFETGLNTYGYGLTIHIIVEG